MSQKYDEYLEKHRQAVKKAYQWIAAYIPELTDVEATRNIEFHDMSKNTPDEYTPYDNYFYGEQTPAIIEAFNRARPSESTKKHWFVCSFGCYCYPVKSK